MLRLILAAILAAMVMMFSAGTHQAFAALADSQRNNTLAFLTSFPGSLKTLSWSGTDYCSFSGVSCDADGYVSISLSGRGLSGYMPDVKEHIDGSQVLVVSIDMSNNRDVSGNFKDSWAALKQLKTLDLSSTGLRGNIPDSWNAMSSLETIKVRNTYACRDLPNWNIATLKSIDLSNNKMGGVLASSWAKMTGLTSVDITGNSFCGCVPSAWNSSTVLTNAAAAIGGNLVSANCNTVNACGKDSHQCPNAVAVPLQLTVALVAMFAVAVAVLGF